MSFFVLLLEVCVKMESWRRELYHYGVKGMRWGVRKAIVTRQGTQGLASHQQKKGIVG